MILSKMAVSQKQTLMNFLTLLLTIGNKAAKPANDPNVIYTETLASDDVDKFDVTQVYTFLLDEEKQKEAYYETSFDIMVSEEHWELDDRLIDYDMLSA